MKLDPRTTTLMRGVGILAIIGHNFQYLVSDLPGVNEFVFERENVEAFLSLVRASPLALPRLLVAFLGHYGVQVFIFLSAFGLTRSFLRAPPAFGVFLRTRVAKLYPPFVLAIVAWALWKGLPEGALGPMHRVSDHWGSLLLKLSLVSNLVRGEQLSLVGPWWFLPFIVQFYVVFPLLFRLSTRGLVALSLAGFALTVGLNETVLPGGFLLATPLGHLPEFCLGIWWGRHPQAELPRGAIVAALLVFLAGNLVAPAWYLSHLAVLVLFLAAWPALAAVLERFGPLEQAVEWIGLLSLELFLVNGFLRDPFMTWAKRAGTERAAVLMGLLSFATCLGWALLLRRLTTRRPPN